MLPEGMTAQQEMRPPPIKFKREAVEDKAASIREGRYMAVDVDFVHVKAPGSLDIYINKVKNWLDIQKQDVDQGRIPQKWLEDYRDAYGRWKNGQEIPLRGTPIKGWGLLSPAQAEMLIKINVLTVEDLAELNDEGMKRIGMGSLELKQKAITALKASKDIGPVVMQVAELTKRLDLSEVNNKALIEQNNALLAEIKARGGLANAPTPSETITAGDLLEAPEAPVAPAPRVEPVVSVAPTPAKRGPGRPRKVKK